MTKVTAWIRTYTGRQVSLVDPQPENIDVIDIAHHLSQICRFTGASREFYSVAQHSVLVASMLSPHTRIHGILHDASEAYLNDVTTPLKHLLPEYMKMEKNMQVAIYRALEVQFPNPQEDTQVRYADTVALATEVRDLGGGRLDEYGLGVEPNKNVIEPLSPPEAEQLWMEEFMKLYRK